MFEYLSTLFSEPLAFFDQAIYRTLAVLIGLCCHEWGHAYVAYRCGDDTAKRAGRMTLNPLRHLDPIGTILMFFVGFGYAKPVPVNPYRFKGDRNRDDFLVSIAGITVNLILFILFTAAGYRDMFRGLDRLRHLDELKKMPKRLPVYFFGGDQDPVGGMGTGVPKVAEQFRQAGLRDVTVKLYPGGRHEMFNETNAQEVCADLLAWLNAH